MDQPVSIIIDTKATAREILAAIDHWALQNYNKEPENLWYILTALRGPDSDDYEEKQKYTCPIRTAVLPQLARKASADTLSSVSYVQLGELVRKHYGDENFHYRNHIRMAAKTILETEVL